MYLDRLSRWKLIRNDSISTTLPQRTGGATVIVRDCMVDRDYHVLRQDQETRPYSPPWIISHVQLTLRRYMTGAFSFMLRLPANRYVPYDLPEVTIS